MKVTYDAEVNILRIILSDKPIEESDEEKPGVIIDYDAAGNVVGMEILDATERVGNPHMVEYAVTGLDKVGYVKSRKNLKIELYSKDAKTT